MKRLEQVIAEVISQFMIAIVNDADERMINAIAASIRNEFCISKHDWWLERNDMMYCYTCGAEKPKEQR